MLKSGRNWIMAAFGVCAMSLLMMDVAAESPTLRGMNGEPRQLEDFVGQGKWLVVMFWAHNCHVCNQEAGNYQAFHDKHKENDAVVLGISIDGDKFKKQAKAFVGRHKLNFTNLIGEPEAVTEKFTELTGVPWLGTPTFLIYTPAGKLVAQQAGGVPVSLIEEFIQEQTATNAS